MGQAVGRFPSRPGASLGLPDSDWSWLAGVLCGKALGRRTAQHPSGRSGWMCSHQGPVSVYLRMASGEAAVGLDAAGWTGRPGCVQYFLQG